MKIGSTIGALAKELNINPKTIRYYEEIGLLSKPQRSESGYRLYSRDEMERLQLVKIAKLLGLSLAEIKDESQNSVWLRLPSSKEITVALSICSSLSFTTLRRGKNFTF